jgi:phage terminase small subunit
MLSRMNIRQTRFAELVASGIPASRAYPEAGYSDRGKNAAAHASRLVENGGVSNRIAELQKESREVARLTKEQKLEILEKIMCSQQEKARDRIAAIKVHNAMVGDNQPSKMIVEAPPYNLDAIRERAKHIVSALSRAHEVRGTPAVVHAETPHT